MLQIQRIPEEIKEKLGNLSFQPYSPDKKNILVIGPIPGKQYSEIIFPILSPDPSKNKNVSLSGIRDIFLYNNNTCKILSIPQDDSITLIEFIDSNQDYFTPMYYRPFPEIFKIYVIDNDFVNKQTLRV